MIAPDKEKPDITVEPAAVQGRLQIAIGRITGSHGVRGEAKCVPFFGEGALRDFVGTEVAIEAEDGSDRVARTLENVRPGGKVSIVKFSGVETPEDVRSYARHTIMVPREKMPDLPEGRYYYEEIVGAPVFDPGGKKLGVLADFFSAGEKDVWVVARPDGGELLIPCVPETLISVDLCERKIVIKPMDETD